MNIESYAFSDGSGRYSVGDMERAAARAAGISYHALIADNNRQAAWLLLSDEWRTAILAAEDQTRSADAKRAPRKLFSGRMESEWEVRDGTAE